MFKIKKSVMSLILAIALILPSVNLSTAQAAGDIDGWTVTYHGDIDAKVSIDNEIYYSGDGALKVEINTPVLGNVYVEVTQQVPVEAGKKYYVGAKVKGENVTRCDLIVNWGTRYNVNQFGSTFDWTNFEYLYRATETGTVTWRITQEGFADGIWVDEAVFIDVETGENLLKNPGFDGAAGSGGEIVAGSISDENLSNDELYARILKADSFAVSDMNKVLGGFKYIPVYQAKNITIDGNTDDWTDYDSVEMPTLSNQYQVYINDGRLMDVKANCKFCYDDKYLYMLIESEDDIYHYLYGSGQYWQGDSLQMSVSTMDEGYGTEIGLAVNPENGDLDVWGLGKTVTPVQAKGSHEGTHTVYEFAFPWDAKFSGVPEKMKFDILVNDNDGDGRRYCAELSPGISEGKTNSKFPVLEFVPGEKDWYGWIQSRSGTDLISGTDYIFDYFIINKSDEEKEFKVIDPDGKTETVKVQGQTGIKRSTVFNFDEEGEFSAGIQIEADGTTAEATVDATISLPPATEDDAAMWIWAHVNSSSSQASQSVLTRPDAVADIGKTALDMTRLSADISEMRANDAKVALFYSKPTRVYTNNHMLYTYRIYQALINAGVKVGFVSENSLDKLPNYDILIMGNVTNGTADAVSAVESFMTNGGKVLYFGNPMTKNEYNVSKSNNIASNANSTSSTATATSGYTFTNGDGIVSAVNSFISSNLDNRVELRYADGTKPAMLDWQYSINDTRVLVNVTNLEYDTPKEIEVYLDGEKLTGMKELRSGQTDISKTTLNGFEPQLLEYRFIVIPDTPAVIDEIDVDVNNKEISWGISNILYEGADVYKLSNAAKFKKVATVSGTSYAYSEPGIYMLKPVLGTTETDGKWIYAGSSDAIKLSAKDESTDSSFNCRIDAVNSASGYVHAVIKVEILDANGNIVAYHYNDTNIKGGKTDSFRVSKPLDKNAVSAVVYAVDSEETQNPISEKITIEL